MQTNKAEEHLRHLDTYATCSSGALSLGRKGDPQDRRLEGTVPRFWLQVSGRCPPKKAGQGARGRRSAPACANRWPGRCSSQGEGLADRPLCSVFPRGRRSQSHEPRRRPGSAGSRERWTRRWRWWPRRSRRRSPWRPWSARPERLDAPYRLPSQEPSASRG